MGFFRSLKGNHPNSVGHSPSNPEPKTETYTPSQGPPPPQRTQQGQIHYLPPAGAPPEFVEYAPPAGPPPGHQNFQPPPGPPPSQNASHGVSLNNSPILGRPQPSSDPPPYHDWTVIPDTALLPPPPSIGHERSPSSNANASDADRAHDWCKRYPLVRPHQPTYAQHEAVGHGDVRLLKPVEYKGDLLMPDTGHWKGSTRAGSKDSCLLSSSPLYFAAADALTGTKKTIYYELKVRSLGRGRGTDESSIALGYCAMPYPTWRMPGWERGSLAVHGDDGRRYVNDTWGGKEFTSPFRVDDTIGLGMTFSTPTVPPDYETSQQGQINVEVFLTRNGEKGERWSLHEELDADNDLGVEGLDGRYDLYAAIGTFGGIEFDISFSRQYWLWRPR